MRLLSKHFVVVVDHLALVRRIVDDVQDYEEVRLGHDTMWIGVN